MNRKRSLVLGAIAAVAVLVAWFLLNSPESETAMGVVVHGDSYDARIQNALEAIDPSYLLLYLVLGAGCLLPWLSKSWTRFSKIGLSGSLLLLLVICATSFGDNRAQLSEEGAEQITNRTKDGERVLSDGPELLKGLPEGVAVEDLFGDPELNDLLHGTDEDAAADAILEADVGVVMMHSRVAPSVDRNATVLSKLYHHDELKRFKLFRIGEGLFYYEVLPAPLTFTRELAVPVFTWLRARLSGTPTRPLPDMKSEIGRWTFMVVIRGKGKELGIGFGHDENLQTALNEAVIRVESHHRRTAEVLGFPPLDEHMKDLTIEVHRVVERAEIEPRGEAFLESLWEMGVDGTFMTTADGKQKGYLPGAVAYTRTLTSADAFLRHAAQAGRMTDRRPWRDPAAHLEVVRTIHWRETPSLAEGRYELVPLVRGVAPVPLEAVTIRSVEESIKHAGDWYMANLEPDGRVVYKFWPAENRKSNEYNLVRHTLATWNLVQAWEMDPTRMDFLEGSRRALDFTQKYLETETVPGGSETMAFYSFNDNQKLGTVVVNILGMVALARATDDHQWDEQLKQMGRFVLYMQEESGTFDGYYVEEGHPYYGQKNDIVPGEAALALITLTAYFDDNHWISTLGSYWEYYKPWWRERVNRQVEGAPWPVYTYGNDDRLELVQFGPWTVMAAQAYYERTGDLEVADFGLEIARWMLEAYQWDADRAPYQDYIGGYYKMEGELPAMQAFCYAEGTAAAYRIALSARPEQAAYFGERTRQTVRFGQQVQLNEFSTYAFSRPEQVDGGIPYAMNETKVRIDYVHHALSAMYQWVLAAREDPELAASVKVDKVLPQQYVRLVRKEKAQAALEPPEPEVSEQVSEQVSEDFVDPDVEPEDEASPE